MSIIGMSNVFDLFTVNIDTFEGLQCSSNLSFPRSGLSAETPFSDASFDWKETAESHVFKIDIPGLKEVKVELEDGIVLKISKERNRDKEEKTDNWHRVEHTSDSFLRSFHLPEKTKADNVNATMENGVLTVTVHKEEVKKPVVKSIKISY